eukprot:scaffold158148_cov30-Tisochrysis_lutea.AAC.2
MRRHDRTPQPMQAPLLQQPQPQLAASQWWRPRGQRGTPETGLAAGVEVGAACEASRQASQRHSLHVVPPSLLRSLRRRRPL